MLTETELKLKKLCHLQAVSLKILRKNCLCFGAEKTQTFKQ